MKKVIIAVVAILVIGLGIFALTRPDKDEAASSASTTQSTQVDDDTDTSTTTPGSETANSVTITFANGEFSPSSVTLNAGDTLKVVNNSSKSVEFSSDPHPSHTNNPELNIGDIEPGKTASITVKNKGTWGYHNHLDASQTGTVIIK